MNTFVHYVNGVLRHLPGFDVERVRAWRTAPRPDVALAFVGELLAAPRAIGAVCPSSSTLAGHLAGFVDPAASGCVVELGGGTGVVTAALLKRGVARDRLVVIERSERFASHLRARFPGLRVVRGDAADIADVVSGQPVAAIVSGLPLRSLPQVDVSRIVRACVGMLGAHSRVIQFSYARKGAPAWTDAGLQRGGRAWVWRNLPPACVEVFSPGTLTMPCPPPAPCATAPAAATATRRRTRTPRRSGPIRWLRRVSRGPARR